MQHSRRVIALQALLPLAVAGLGVISEYSGFDLYLARFFYDPVTQTWPLKSNFFTAGVLHEGGKNFVVYAMVGIFLFFIASFLIKKLRPCRKGAGYLLLGSLPSPAIVALLKSTTHIYIPWKLEMFGGDKPYVRLFDAAPEGLSAGHAFPGGHSSGGFAFVSLYFLLSVYRPQYRYYGLAFGLGLGFLFALTQEIRGAHFLSHDLFSLVICWYVALTVYYLMFRREISAGESVSVSQGGSNRE